MLSISQRELNLKTYYYYYKGDIDGIEGTKLKTAYGNFQRDNGLIVDKIYGNNTENKLLLCIKELQSLLNKHGYDLVIDGLVGNKTIFAIKDFQKKNGLVVDGIAGTQTMNKLKNSSSSSNSNILSWNDIKNFKKSEFDCACGCGFNNIDLRIVKILDYYFRSHFNAPTYVTSGCRCQKYNDSLKGSVKWSKHVQGKGVDFYVKGVDVNIVLSWAKELCKKGIIRYAYTNSSNMRGAIHIDIE